jgi:hypothetical protein
MNKEQQELLDDSYKRYEQYHINEALKENPEQTIIILSQEGYINKCRTDQEFSEQWGLKIEERELSEKERIILAGYDYENRGGIGWNMVKESVDMDSSIPTKLITITYNNTTIESYEK